jgi:hypothetical protein
MGAGQMVEAVIMQEFLQYFFAENVSCSSRRYDKTSLSFLRVAPHHIAEWSVMRNLLKPVQAFYLVN